MIASRAVWACNRVLYRAISSYGRADKLLKHYIDNRFKMTEQDLVGTVVGLTKCKVKTGDSRFVNLRTTVQRKMNELQLETRVRLAWGLVKIKDNNELVKELLTSLRGSVKHMDFGEVATVMWALTKNNAKDANYMLELTKRAQELLSREGVTVVGDAKQTDENLSEEEQSEEELAYVPSTVQNETTVKALDCSIVVWSIAAQNLIDKRTYDLIVKQFVLTHLETFNTRMLVIVLYACERTKYQRKSIQRLYQAIR